MLWIPAGSYTEKGIVELFRGGVRVIDKKKLQSLVSPLLMP